MRIAILETGTPPGDLARRHGRYDAMVRDLLGDDHAYTSFRPFDGALPENAAAFDAHVVTGSSAGVHDGLPWVETLAAFLRTAKGRTKLIGLCFGHQVMAHAFGGTVEKSGQGWGLGLHRYTLTNRPAWMGEARNVAVMASHQDQVVVPPPGAVVIGTSPFTPNAMIDHGDGAVSFQCHPEFTHCFSRELIDAHAAPDISATMKEDARQSLGEAGDAATLARWIDRILRD